MSPATAVCSHFLQACWVDVAEDRSSYGSSASGKLSVQHVFWYPAIVHTVNMAEPLESSLAEQGKHVVHSCLHHFVGDTVLPSASQDSSEAAHVEAVELSDLAGAQGPGLASVKERAEYTSQ